MGQGYGKIGRRRGSGSWQWLLIGFFPGLLCGGFVVFLLILTGMFEGLGSAEATPAVITQVVEVQQIITATPDPNSAPTAQIVTATSESASAGSETGDSVITFATETPTANPSQAAQTETASAAGGSITPPGSQNNAETLINPTSEAPTVAAAAPADASTANAQTNTDIPPQLAQISSPMVTIQGGMFAMGTTPLEIASAVDQCQQRDGGNCEASFGQDSTPQVQVELQPFQIEQTEVSFNQYTTFLNWLSSQGISHRTGCSGFPCIQTQNEDPNNAIITFDSANYNVPSTLNNYPVYGVTWYGAQAYCEALGRRLPTEAEWEFSAKGGDGFVYPWGNQWTEANAKTRIPRDAAAPVPIDDYPLGRSPFGALNMAGNVAEWVQDWYDPNYYSSLFQQQPVVDPQGPPTGVQKVLRGGSWDALPFFARTVHRQSWPPAPDNLNETYPRWIGFRCAADADANNVPVNPDTDGADPPALDNTIPATGVATTPESIPGLPPTNAPPEAQATPVTQDNRG